MFQVAQTGDAAIGGTMGRTFKMYGALVKVMTQVAELLRWKDFLPRITSADCRVGWCAKKCRRLITASLPLLKDSMATVNEAEFDQSVAILRNSFAQYPGTLHPFWNPVICLESGSLARGLQQISRSRASSSSIVSPSSRTHRLSIY
jgi:hypothetical protein